MGSPTKNIIILMVTVTGQGDNPMDALFCLTICFFFLVCTEHSLHSLAVKVPTWSTVFGARLPLHGLKQGKTSAGPPSLGK